MTAPRTHHIDKRATRIAETVAGDDDDLLPTPDIAAWLEVSVQWLEIGRFKGYGPPFMRVSDRMIRYRRGDVRQWLRERTHQRTSEYVKPRRKRADAAGG
jgi:hypothetical protein